MVAERGIVYVVEVVEMMAIALVLEHLRMVEPSSGLIVLSSGDYLVGAPARPPPRLHRGNNHPAPTRIKPCMLLYPLRPK